jgi:cell division protease FtsH
MGADVDLRELAYSTSGYTGAALANIVNLGALLAAKNERNCITQADLMGALELETLGKVASEHFSDERKKRLAVHEASKALLAELLPEIEPVELVTIVPRESYH